MALQPGGGNVGIGTTNPGMPLSLSVNNSVAGNLSAMRITQAGAGDAAISFLLSGVNEYMIGIDNSDSDKFKIQSTTGGSDFVTAGITMDTSGNVGIGTTAPGVKLHVAATTGSPVQYITAGDNSQAALFFATNYSSTPDWAGIGIKTDGSLALTGGASVNSPDMVITNTGNVGIGTTDASAGKLVVNTGGTAGWDKFVVANSTLWGDGSTQFVTIGTGASGIMLFNPHVVWNSANSAAALRMGRSGGVSTGAYYEIGTGPSDSFYISKNAVQASPQFYINSSGNVTIAGTVSAPNYSDATGAYNVNLGSNGSEGRGVVAGYSGGAYGGIGYNVRHTVTSATYIAPGTDTSSYLRFDGGGFIFYGAPGGTAGRTLSYTSLATLSPAGALTTAGQIYSQSGGVKFPDASVQTTAYLGGSQTLVAGNVGAGTFGSNTGGGNYSFPANLTVVGSIVQNNGATLVSSNSTGGQETWMWPRWSDNIMYTNFGSAGWNIRNNASANVMFLQSGGNVGIGTTNPGAKFEVNGSVIVDSTALASYTEGIRVNAASNGYAAIFYGGAASSVSGSGAGQWWGGRNGSTNAFQFAENGTTMMTILPTSGNVGIGTATPRGQLDVSTPLNNIDGTVIGQLNGDNTNTIQTYIDNQYGNWGYAGGCCNTLYIQPQGGDLTLGNARGVTVTGPLTAASFSGAGTGLTGTAASLTVGTATNASNASNVTGGALSGNLVASNYGIGNVGVYSDVRYQALWSMGTSYMLPADGSTPGSLYGLAWTHSNIGGQSKAGLSHQLLVMEAGVTKTAIGTGIWTAGTITAAGQIYSSSGGIKFPDATIQTTAYLGGSQTLVAGNVAAGSFGSNTGGGNYTFPATLTATTFTGTLNGAAPWDSVSGRPVWLSGGSYVETHSDANAIVNSGFYENGGCGTNWPSCTWYNSLTVRHSNQGNGHGFMVAMSYYDNNLWFRSFQGALSPTYQTWAYAISNQNIGSQSVSYATTAGSAPANGGNAASVNGQSFAWANNNNNPTYLWAADSNGSAYLAARTGMTVGVANGVNQLPNRTDGTFYQINWNNAATGDTNLYSSAMITLRSSGYGAIGWNGNAWYIEGNATYGLYSNTGLYANGGLWDAGNRVYSAGNPQVNISGSAGSAATATNFNNGTSYSSGQYVYAGYNMRLGEIAGNGGLYRSTGWMTFYVENSGWDWRVGNVVKATLDASGNLATVGNITATYTAANSVATTPALIINNPAGGTQTAVAWKTNGTLRGLARADSTGNFVISPGSGGNLYLNWDSGNGSTIIGNGAQSATGKITVGTVDPPYTIGGAQYATYLPGMVGQKEETTGELSLPCANGVCKSTIDFNSVEKGSDLWLFSRTADLRKNIGAMTVLLTPSFDGRVWYEKDPTNLTLTIYGTPSSSTFHILDSTFSVSYRLTAPRFDSANFPNTRSDGVNGLPAPEWIN